MATARCVYPEDFTAAQRKQIEDLLGLFGEKRTPIRAWVSPSDGSVRVIDLPDDASGYWHEIKLAEHFDAGRPHRADGSGTVWAIVPHPQKPAWM